MIAYYLGYCTDADDDDTSICWICETFDPSESVCSSVRRDYRHEDHRQYQEHAFRTALSALSVNSVRTEALFGRRYRKTLFSKSGFVGRVGRMRKR